MLCGGGRFRQRVIREELAAGKGPRTGQLAHNTLRTALKQAELWGIVPRNVARLVAPPRYASGLRQSELLGL